MTWQDIEALEALLKAPQDALWRMVGREIERLRMNPETMLPVVRHLASIADDPAAIRRRQDDVDAELRKFESSADSGPSWASALAALSFERRLLNRFQQRAA